MADNKDMQAAFMEALNGLKEYAKVNGNIVTKEDVNSYFKDMHLDDNKYSMITGYLMANGITIKGEDGTDNEFLHMLESTADDSVKNDENGIVIDDNADTQKVDDNQGNNSISEDNKNHINSESNNDGLITKINISEEEVKSLPEKEAAMAAQMIADNMDYSEDDVYLERYKKELEAIQPVSDTTRAYLLINIVEDNDKESLKILSESYLEKIVEWVEPYRCRGVLAADLVQESNLAMMSYIGQKLWLNNYEWKDKIKEGSTNDIIEVLCGIDKEVKYQAEESMRMLIDEQMDSNRVSGKVLNKVNYVNDWAVRLKEELGRKPTVKEVAERMGVAEDVVSEALSLSADKIEDINVEDKNN
uniref:sigma-70 domain-containing protein n=1 Tax=Lachnospira sp. TaxID=2049031 RepID=UPI003FEF4AFF